MLFIDIARDTLQTLWKKVTNHKGMELMVRYQSYKGDRFMIRLPAKLDLAAPEADSDVESDEDMKCT